LKDWRRNDARKRQDYDGWWTRQRGLCAFCGLPMDYESQTTHLDHNHVTGVKRGLVHAKCNVIIGGIERGIALVGLERLLAYLKA
jgi:hypothetical protein